MNQFNIQTHKTVLQGICVYLLLLLFIQTPVRAALPVSVRTDIEKICKDYKADISVSMLHTGQNDTFTFRGFENFPLQSVYKFPQALCVYHLAETGKLDLNRKVTVDQKTLDIYPWSPMKDQHPGSSLSLSIAELVAYTLGYSDNLACDMLFDAVGGTKVVQAYMNEIGFREIKVKYTEAQIFKHVQNYAGNVAPARSLTQLLLKFKQGKLLNAENTATLLRLMTEDFSSYTRIRGCLPPDVKVAHKTGTGGADNVIFACNDIGIVSMPDGSDMYLSVLVKNAHETYATTEYIIARIAQYFYDYYSRPQHHKVKEQPYGSNMFAGHYITLNGVKHYYETYGSGKPLLLIHGNSTPIRGFAPQIDYFRSRYKVIAIDCRARGNSAMGTDSLTYEGMASDMCELLEKLQLDSVNVVGKSDGAIVALLMGMQASARINKIVAFAANLVPDSTGLFTEVIEDTRKEWQEAEDKLKQEPKNEEHQKTVWRLRMLMFQPHIALTELEKIKVPVLVMSTDRDLIPETHTLQIYQHIPKASLCIVSGERHGFAKQNPELFNSLVYSYLQGEYKDHGYRFQK